MESNSQNLLSEVPFSLQKPKSNADCVQEGEVQNSISQNQNDEQENCSHIFSNASHPDELPKGILLALPTPVPSQGLNQSNHQSDGEENDSHSETSSCSHSLQETTSSSDSSLLEGAESFQIDAQNTSLLEMYIRDYDIDPSETSDYSDVEQESSQISIQSSISISSSVSSNRSIFLFDPMHDDDDENASMMSLDYQYFDLD